MRMLVTGGTGGLGREVVPRLLKNGHTVRIMSRRRGDNNATGDVEWAQADMAQGNGIADAVQGVDTIVHLASNPLKHKQDVEGTRRLAGAAKAANIGHFFYISIVGIDKVGLGYYKTKLACEKIIEESGVPYSILRETQFHTLLDHFFLPMFKKWRFLFLPRSAKFQLMDVGEAADRLVEALEKGTSGHHPDIGGPEVLDAGTIAEMWLRARGEKAIGIPLPAWGPLSGLAKAYNCCPDSIGGKITWGEYLEKRYGS